MSHGNTGESEEKHTQIAWRIHTTLFGARPKVGARSWLAITAYIRAFSL